MLTPYGIMVVEKVEAEYIFEEMGIGHWCLIGGGPYEYGVCTGWISLPRLFIGRASLFTKPTFADTFPRKSSRLRSLRASQHSTITMKPIIAVPATLALVYRAWSHKSLTPLGIFFAALTAVAHAVHPWSLPFVLLCVFFLAGTRVTKVWLSQYYRGNVHMLRSS